MEFAANIIHISLLKYIILKWEKAIIVHLRKGGTGLNGMLLASRSIATMEKRVCKSIFKVAQWKHIFEIKHSGLYH